MLAHIVVSKYVDHLPLYRQSQIFKREQDVHLAESTLNDRFSATCRSLEPLHDVLQRGVQQSHYLQADETPIPMQTRNKPGATHKGYLWVYYSPPDKLVLFDYSNSRSREEPGDMLKSFQGALQCDGYQAYDVYEKAPGIELLASWAHARRKSEQSLDNDKLRSEYAMEKIRQLYLDEREAEELDPDQRKALRQEKSLPVLQELKTWMIDQLNEVLPKRPIGKAIQDILGLWDSLERYTRDGTWLIDNNRIYPPGNLGPEKLPVCWKSRHCPVRSHDVFVTRYYQNEWNKSLEIAQSCSHGYSAMEGQSIGGTSSD